MHPSTTGNSEERLCSSPLFFVDVFILILPDVHFMLFIAFLLLVKRPQLKSG